MTDINVRIARSDDHVITINQAAFADHVQAFIFNYGIRQLLNDAGASFKTVDEKFDAAHAKWQRLLDGEIGRAPAAGVDSLTKEMITMATEHFHAIIRKPGSGYASVKAYKAIEGKAEKLEAAIAARVESGVDKEAAQERIAAKKAAVANVTESLDDLGL